MKQWNDDQIKAINSADRNTLVSASAGSGKTAVTIERIIRLIKHGTPVRRIVMLAFSNAVAAELKDRISSELVKAMREDGADRDFLREQIDDVAMADISTVHSFCGNLVKEFFEEAGVDPSYSILEPSESVGMLDKAIDVVLKEYGEKADPVVSSLKFLFGSDAELRAAIKEVHGFLEAQTDREKWLQNAPEGCGTTDEAAEYLISELRNKTAEIGRAARQTAERLNEFPGFDPSNRVELTLLADACERAADAEGAAFIDAVAGIDFSFTAGRRAAKATILKAARDAGRDVDAEFVYDEIKAMQREVAAKCKAWGEKILKISAYSAKEWENYGQGSRLYAKKLAEIVFKVAAEYGARKQSENKMDFADLEYYAIKILKNDEIAKEVSLRYDYVCIDEYQDTNYVQEFVLSRISNGKNLFMVGDVKQSIYQFRLTETGIFLDKMQGYLQDPSAGRLVTLNENFRSDGRILDFVNRVFSRIMTKETGGVDYADSSMFRIKEPLVEDGEQVVRICPLPKTKKSGGVELPDDGVYSVREDVPQEEDVFAEARYIANKIADLVGKKEIEYKDGDEIKRRKLRFGDITLLCSSRSRRVQAIVGHLHRLGVPLSDANITRKKEVASVRILLDLLLAIDNPRQDVALVAVMKSVFGGFDLTELAAVRKEYPKEDYFWTCVEKYACEKDDPLAEKLRSFSKSMQKLRDESGQVTACKLLENAVAEYNFDKYVVAHFGNEDCERMRAFIAGLADKSYALTLQSLLAYGEDASVVAESAERPQDADCVQTSTIHSSKGLEYPVVFLIDASEMFSGKMRYGDLLLDKDLGIAIRYPEEDTRLKKNTLKYLACEYRLNKKYVEERMRLFYVALTRAKNMLFITGEATNFGTTEKVSNSFMDWLGNVCCADRSFYDRYVERYDMADDGDEEEEEPPSVTFAKPDEAMLKELDGYLNFVYPFADSAKTGIKHTVTGINKENPDDYGTAYVKSWFEEDSAGVGTAYHKVMENVDYDSPSAEAVRMQIDKMCEDGVLDLAERAAVDENVVFRCLCSDVITKARACVHMREKQFMLRVKAKDVLDVDVEDMILVQGTIDLLIPDRVNGTATVVDFKMSRLAPSVIADKYRKQLQLYALAAERGLGLRVDKKLIYVLGQDVVLQV